MPNGIIFSARDFTGIRHVPFSYSQKMAILGDGAVLALGAGTFSVVKMVITDLKTRLRQGLQINDLHDWLATKSAICGDHTTVVVGWVTSTQYMTASTGRPPRMMELRGSVAAFAGSGSEWLEALPVSIGRRHVEVGQFDEGEYVRMQAIAQTGFHLLNQRTIGTKDAFGGGFQTAYFDGVRFRMSEDVTFLMWKMIHDDTEATDSLGSLPTNCSPTISGALALFRRG